MWYPIKMESQHLHRTMRIWTVAREDAIEFSSVDYWNSLLTVTSYCVFTVKA